MPKDPFKQFTKTIENSANVGDQLPSSESEQTTPIQSSNTPSDQGKTATLSKKQKRSVNENYVQRCFQLREELAESISIISFKTKRSFKQIVNELIQEFVDKNKELL